MLKKLSILALALLPWSAIAGDIPEVVVPAARDAEWHSYRHAYKAARFFTPFLATRPLIQAHMQIRPNTPDEPMAGLRLHLTGEHVDMDIPVDPLGRATLPMLKAAYDDDAVLRLNRRRGHYQFSGRYSIRERADGIYSAASLREACEQLIGAQRESGYRLRLIGRRCAGVKFVFPLDDVAPQVVYRDAAGTVTPLVAEAGLPFEDGSMGRYRVAVFRFAAWPGDGEVVVGGGLIGVGSLYE